MSNAAGAGEFVITGAGLVGDRSDCDIAGLGDVFALLSANLDQAGIEWTEGVVGPLKRRLRFVDPVAESGLRAACHAAVTAGLHTEAQRCWRELGAVVLATHAGPARARRELYESLARRNGKAVSGIAFSNCGYNTLIAIMAQGLGARGPGLLVGANDRATSALQVAQRLLQAGRAELAFVGHAAAQHTLVFCIERGASARERGLGTAWVPLPERSASVDGASALTDALKQFATGRFTDWKA